MFVTDIKHETDIGGGDGKISDAMMRSQMVELRDAGATTLSFRQPLYHAFKAANRKSVHRLRPGIKHTYIDNLTITTNGNAVNFIGVKIAGGVDIRLRNVDLRQTNNGFDRICLRLDSVLSLEALDSDFTTEANDQGSDAAHPYCVSIGTGGSHVYMNCQADTEGWQDAIDRQFSNSGGETGNKKGPTAQIANVGIVTVDCRFNRRNRKLFPNEKDSVRQASSGGHEACDRRDICASALKGAVVTRWAYGVDYVGLDAGQHYLQFIGGRHVYFHYFRCRNEPSGRDQVYQSRDGDQNFDMYVSGVSFTGSSSNPQKFLGNHKRCRFDNCSTPHP